MSGRSFQATWNADTLRFEFGPADLANADALQGAMAFVIGFNSRPNPEEDWMGRATANPIRELVAPDSDGQWVLGVTAPWANPQSASSEDTLPVISNVSVLKSGDVVRGFLDMARPNYWGVLDQWAEIVNDPAFVMAEGLLQPFVDGLAAALRR